MRPFSWILLTLLLLGGAAKCSATIFDEKKLTIDFTSTNATAQCTWSPSEGYAITREGLGWDRSPNGPEMNGGSILTHPFAIGFFWQPATSVRIKAEIKPGPREYRTPDGKPYWENGGRMFLRHSPDRVHWSSWQELSRNSRSNLVYEGMIGVPGREREEYEKLRIEFQNSHEDSGSNEEAAVRAIVKKYPDFFSKHLPFVGYVQLLFEGEFITGFRFKEFNAVFCYSVGGLLSEPGGPEEKEQFRREMFTVPWRFEGTAKSE